MRKALVALAIAGAMSAPVVATLHTREGIACARPGCNKLRYRSKQYCSSICARTHKAEIQNRAKS